MQHFPRGRLEEGYTGRVGEVETLLGRVQRVVGFWVMADYDVVYGFEKALAILRREI